MSYRDSTHVHQPLQKHTQELSKILLRLFNFLQKNGRESHRYEKKTVFDILGVMYNCFVTFYKKNSVFFVVGILIYISLIAPWHCFNLAKQTIWIL
ncbi:hypothetical protein BW898_22540 [Bacillus cereus]|nr:hypothetical protein BW898_22540 [Bacillus cereus]